MFMFMCCGGGQSDGTVVVAVEEEFEGSRTMVKMSTEDANASLPTKAPYIGFEGENRGYGREREAKALQEEPKVEPKPMYQEPPKVELPAAKGVEVEFVTGTGSQKVSLVRRPIGLTFELTSSRPVAVKSVTVGGHAEQLGVQAGWTFKTIAGTDCSLMDQTMVIGAMRDATKGLQGSLEVEFKSAEGQVFCTHFTKMPLDMKFASAKPFSVTAVTPGGHADKLGVRQDWVITKVGGKVVEDMEGADFTAHFRSQVANLLQTGL